MNTMADETPFTRLTNPLDINQLCSGGGAMWEVNVREDVDESEDVEQAFGLDTVEPYSLNRFISDDDEHHFDFITKGPNRAMPMESCPQILKKVMEPGKGERLEAGENVFIHYHGYHDSELEGKPFDVSKIRTENPERYKLGRGELFTGFEIAVLSMVKGEISAFVIPPKLAYGENGCLNRVPANATLLYFIHLVDHCKYLEEKAEMSNLEKARQYHETGNNYINKEKKYEVAEAQYKKALHLFFLEWRMNGDKSVVKDLVKVYANIALCCNTAKKYKETILFCEAAFKDVPEEADSNFKLNYRLGIAHRKLKNYDKAVEYIKKALSLDETNTAIGQEYEQLCQEIKKMRGEEKKLWSNAFPGFKDVREAQAKESSEKKQDVYAREVDELTKKLKTILIDGETEKYAIPAVECEIPHAIIEKLCKDLQLKLEIGDRYLTIRK